MSQSIKTAAAACVTVAPPCSDGSYGPTSMQRRQMLNAALAGAAAPAAAAAAPASTAERVAELDRRLNRAILARDAAVAGALYDDDFVLTVAGGGFKRKADMLADITNPALVLVACETREERVRVRGGAAVLTGLLRQAGTLGGRAFDHTLQVTDTWGEVDGRWLLLAGHASLARG